MTNEAPSGEAPSGEAGVDDDSSGFRTDASTPAQVQEQALIAEYRGAAEFAAAQQLQAAAAAREAEDLAQRVREAGLDPAAVLLSEQPAAETPAEPAPEV